MISLLCGILKIQQTSEYNNNNNNKTDSQIYRTNQWLPVGRGQEGGANKGRGLRGTKYYVENKVEGYI